MPTYLLSICYPEGSQQPPDHELAVIMANVTALNEEIAAAGAWVFAGGLHDASTSTVVTETDGTILMTDGPFIESKEQLGGITIITATDLDEALGWAGRLAHAVTCPVEVRPFMHAHSH